MRPLLDARNPDHRVYEVGGTWTANATVGVNESFTLRTLDASGNQIRPGITDISQVSAGQLFPATGPVAVDGVNAGDGVAVDIIGINPVEYGHIWTRPGLGIGPSPTFQVTRVHLDQLRLELGELSVPMEARLHVGTLGVAPQDPTLARDVGTHGGNIDSSFLRPGARVLFTAQTAGAGIFAADVHAAIGDAEVCGTGVETEATIELRAHKSAWAPPLPVILDGGRVWAVGTGASVEEALDVAVRFIHDRLMAELALPAGTAYLAVAALLEVQLCQVVNPHHSVAVSLRSGLDRHLAPAGFRPFARTESTIVESLQAAR